MAHPSTTQTFISILLLGLIIPTSPVRGQEAQSLELEGVLELARERNPRLRAAQRMVEAARAREAGAGLLPDPTLQVGVANLAIPEFSASMPASMAPTFQAVQRFPWAGKLSLQREMADQSTGISAARADETWWEVRTEVASAFYQIYQMDEQIRVMEETLGLLADFQIVARSMYEVGTGRQADVLRANVEMARMEAEIERNRAMRMAAASRLNAQLDRPAGTPVPTPRLGSLPARVPEQDTLRSWALGTRPALAGLQWEVARAGTGRHLAEKAIWPDLTVGLQYGLGRMGGELKSMGGASIAFTLPLYAGKRQMKARDEAAAMEAAAEARFSQTLALVDSRIGETLADLHQARTLLTLYRDEILPQAQATVESSLSAYRVGAVDFMTLVDAQMALNRFQGEYFGLLASYGTGIARLEMTIGRELPVTTELHVENS
jgi:outer membrane protein TolC